MPPKYPTIQNNSDIHGSLCLTISHIPRFVAEDSSGISPKSGPLESSSGRLASHDGQRPPSPCEGEIERRFVHWKRSRHFLVGGLQHEFYFPIYWEFHHPNWLSYFSEGWPNHQPVGVSIVMGVAPNHPSDVGCDILTNKPSKCSWYPHEWKPPISYINFSGING